MARTTTSPSPQSHKILLVQIAMPLLSYFPFCAIRFDSIPQKTSAIVRYLPLIDHVEYICYSTLDDHFLLIVQARIGGKSKKKTCVQTCSAIQPSSHRVSITFSLASIENRSRAHRRSEEEAIMKGVAAHSAPVGDPQRCLPDEHSPGSMPSIKSIFRLVTLSFKK